MYISHLNNQNLQVFYCIKADSDSSMLEVWEFTQLHGSVIISKRLYLDRWKWIQSKQWAVQTDVQDTI